jgi:mannose-6-phosphate isomerase
MTVRRMENPVMAYAWGSRDAIATLQGRPAATDSEAELWMGAHPAAPSRLQSSDGEPAQGLDAIIAADPLGVLGKDCLERFGPRLPFLLKVLAAEQPLSLQVHPDDAQARRGFAAEDAAGIERDSAQRWYRDPYAKPEMLVALTDFEVLQGFRPADEAAAVLGGLGIDRLDPLTDALRSGTPTGEVFLRLIEWPRADRAALVADVSSAGAGGVVGGWVARLAAAYPSDPGVVGVLLLNYLTLRPSQGLYVRPGQIHAYLHGFGVEILGGSDNVIRGGLTPKQVSGSELRAILAVDAAEPAVVEPAPVETVQLDAPGGAEQIWMTPQPEFELRRKHIGATGKAARELLAAGGPAVLLCLEGQLQICDRDGALTIGPGESAFAFAGAELEVGGSGVLLLATPGATPRVA